MRKSKKSEKLKSVLMGKTFEKSLVADGEDGGDNDDVGDDDGDDDDDDDARRGGADNDDRLMKALKHKNTLLEYDKNRL